MPTTFTSAPALCDSYNIAFRAHRLVPRSVPSWRSCWADSCYGSRPRDSLISLRFSRPWTGPSRRRGWSWCCFCVYLPWCPSVSSTTSCESISFLFTALKSGSFDGSTWILSPFWCCRIFLHSAAVGTNRETTWIPRALLVVHWMCRGYCSTAVTPPCCVIAAEYYTIQCHCPIARMSAWWNNAFATCGHPSPVSPLFPWSHLYKRRV